MKCKYNNQEERNQILQEKSENGFYLLEEQNITEGNFLIFGEKPNSSTPIQPSEVNILKAQLNATVERQEFIEDLIAELAMMVYD